MLCHQKGKVGVLCLLVQSLIAVTVYGDNAIGILAYHDAVGIHTEGTDIILKLMGTVDDLALIKFIGQVRENDSRKLDTDTEIHTVGFGRDIHLLTNFFHPFASASSDGNNTLITVKKFIRTVDPVPACQLFHPLYRFVKIKFHFILQFIEKILQNHIVDIGSQVAYRSIQKVQTVLHTDLFESGSCRRIQLCSLSAVEQIDLIHVLHQFDSRLFTDMFVQSAAKIIGDVIFSVRKCTSSAETAHDGTALTVDTGLDLHTVDRTFSLIQHVTGLKDSHLQFRFLFHQFISRKNSSGTCTDDDNIISFHRLPPLFVYSFSLLIIRKFPLANKGKSGFYDLFFPYRKCLL